MIVVDTALRRRHEEGNPVKVGIVGCGFLGKALARQIHDRVQGMEVVCIATRTPDKALEVFDGSAELPTSLTQLNEAIAAGRHSVIEDPLMLCQADGIDVIIDACGSITMGAEVAFQCLDHQKHLVLVNAELDATVGPVLHHMARKKGLIFTGTDGDQPGSQLNLLRHVQSMGLKPLVAGNIKGLQDHYRNPDTQAAFAKDWGQNPWMVTSFADGTKISFEQALVANATGFISSQRGMIGMEFKGHVDQLTSKYDPDFLLSQNGIIDYVVGPQPGPGVYIIAYEDDPERQHYLKYFKMGDGPLYSFYTPFHLCHLEAPITAARAVLLNDPAISPIAGPVVDVIAVTKKPLKKGDKLDAIGGFTCYGVCENSQSVQKHNLLPIGLAENATLIKDLPIDHPISYQDISPLPNSPIHSLRSQQNSLFT